MSDTGNETNTITLAPCNHYLIALNEHGEIRFCNQTFKNKFLPQEDTGIAIKNFITENDKIKFSEAFAACLSSPGECIYGISCMINRNENAHYVKWELVAEHNGKTIIVYMMGHSINDLSDSQNEEGMSGKILQSIFESTEDLKLFVSPNFRILFFNSKAYEKAFLVFGKKMKLGDSILDYLRDSYDQIDEGFFTAFTRALNGEIVIRESESNDYKKLDWLYFRSEYYPVYENDKLKGISITVSDITGQHKHAESIRLQNEKLRKIAFIQSHQVRQPLSNILGILSFIKTEGISEDDQYLINILKLSAQQLDNVVRKIVIEAQHTGEHNEILQKNSDFQKT